ncbi:hypothetical protein Mal64_36610 [Pseudobythopirellula maris]|uniref:Uncharacterized protein n=1 Tax=Pseudobythopirellula maris TaxID=2527991 RepID=A0A5C5ZJ40_9BACT|nr:hypothetical protein [Pseudobythopirellula maris]TWT86831.1 hypothetical protein Mal64_36610 [Pseudobythopirellula maris]
MSWFETIADLDAGTETLRRRRYGVIETEAGALRAVHLRPWPKLLSLREVLPLGDRYHATGEGDRCWLYYNQPRGHSKFLALKYVVTTPDAKYATFRAALKALDRVAEIKRSDALLCDAANRRLSDRFLQRMGWEAHAPQWGRRNFIRRFYGDYPVHG